MNSEVKPSYQCSNIYLGRNSRFCYNPICSAPISHRTINQINIARSTTPYRTNYQLLIRTEKTRSSKPAFYMG